MYFLRETKIIDNLKNKSDRNNLPHCKIASLINIVYSGQTELHFMYHFCFSFFTMENYHLYPIIVILSIISIICPPDSFSLKLRHASLILKFLLTDFYCGWYDGYLQTNGGPVWYSNIFTGKNQSMKTLT